MLYLRSLIPYFTINWKACLRVLWFLVPKGILVVLNNTTKPSHLIHYDKIYSCRCNSSLNFPLCGSSKMTQKCRRELYFWNVFVVKLTRLYEENKVRQGWLNYKASIQFATCNIRTNDSIPCTHYSPEVTLFGSSALLLTSFKLMLCFHFCLTGILSIIGNLRPGLFPEDLMTDPCLLSRFSFVSV